MGGFFLGRDSLHFDDQTPTTGGNLIRAQTGLVGCTDLNCTSDVAVATFARDHYGCV
jgi:hypothetical protein